MTEEQYKEAKKALTKEHEEKLSKLNRDFALSNNPYEIGDIITDHIGAMKIEKINATYGGLFSSDLPMCVYFGTELKKDGTPMKKQSGRCIWQSSILMPA